MKFSTLETEEVVVEKHLTEIVDITEMLLVVKYSIAPSGKIVPISLIRSRRV
jgi:hypothetical protein